MTKRRSTFWGGKLAAKARFGLGNFSSGKASDEAGEGAYIGYVTEQAEEAGAAWRKISSPKSWWQ